MKTEMTALEACSKIEEAINALHVESRTEGWDWCFTKAQPDLAHLADHQETLEKTRAHFSLDGDTSMWFVGTHESNAILANCGNSPTAEARSRYISWVNPQNLMLLITRLRQLETGRLGDGTICDEGLVRPLEKGMLMPREE